jgi:hypothetical protein
MENTNDKKESLIPYGAWGQLQESGILLENGDILAEGRIFEVARELKRLWEAKNYNGFGELLSNCGIEGEEYHKLSHTIITEEGATVFWVLDKVCDILDEDEED